MMRALVLACLLAAAGAASSRAQATAWDSVGRLLGTPDVFAAGYHRYNLPRRDLTVRIGDVTVAPALALGAWAGFSGTPEAAVAMGDLIVTTRELSPVLAELARDSIEVTAIHNHLVGEEPRLIYVHFHAQGAATAVARRLDRVVARTGTPRPVAATPAQPPALDTAAIFAALGKSGRAQGRVAQLGFNLVPGDVTMEGQSVVPALGYGSPVNIQMVDASRAVATGDFAVPGTRVNPLLEALAAHGITATAVHSHLIGETPQVYFIHYWADGKLESVLAGLRAALDAAR